MQTFVLTMAFAWLQIVQPAVATGLGCDWRRVQLLPVGTSIQAATKSSHGHCKLKSVDADTLTCTHEKDVVFQRADIVTIKVPCCRPSALVGTTIGGATGAVAGFASAGCSAGSGCFVPSPVGGYYSPFREPA